MIKSSGTLIIQNKKILLCHPTNSSWYGTYSIPKGLIEKNESTFECAKRELKEETGIYIPDEYYDKNEYFIDYKSKDGITYKRVYYFVANLPDNYISEVINNHDLQLDEVDWAGFLDYDKATKKIFQRQKELLKFLL